MKFMKTRKSTASNSVEYKATPKYIDVMFKGEFVCQLNVSSLGHIEFVGDKIMKVYSEDELRKFVEEKKPRLVGKDFKVEFSNQRVW